MGAGMNGQRATKIETTAQQEEAPAVKVELVTGHPGGFVNRLGRRVAPGEAVTVSPDVAAFLIKLGDFRTAE